MGADGKQFSLRGTEKAHKLFQHELFGPHPKPPVWAPRKKFMCLISWERTTKGDPHKLFRREFGGQKRGPKRTVFGHKKFSLSFFSCPYDSIMISLVSAPELSPACDSPENDCTEVYFVTRPLFQ